MHTNPFDVVADLYDDDFSDTLIGRSQRVKVWNCLDKVINNRNGLNIVELNCGTGIDAIYLAKQGHHILATDSSSKMLTQVNNKVEEYGLQDFVQTALLDLTEIGAISLDKGCQLLLSNFGGINCLSPDQLIKLASILRVQLNSEVDIILVVMPRYCLMDLSYRLVKLEFRKLYNRLFNPSVQVPLGRSSVSTHYHSPSFVRSAFGKFKYCHTEVIGIWPSYLNNLIKKRPFLLIIEKVLIRMFSINRVFCNLADHYLIHLKS